MVKDIVAIRETPESKPSRYLYKRGAIFSSEWTRLSDGAWLPKHLYSNLQERVWLNLSNEDSSSLMRRVGDWTYSDYKKFRVTTKIVPQANSGDPQ